MMSDDRTALEELLRVSVPGAPHTVLHYLYVPTREAAIKVAIDLRCRGFSTQERLGADGVNWLVLARHDLFLSEEALVATRQMMDAIVGSRGGEYDGWEAETQQSPKSATDESTTR